MSQSFSDRLVKSLNLSGVNQVQLAKKLGKTKQAVSLWIQGKSVPSMSIIEQISKTLNVDFIWLLSGGGVEPVAETIRKELENAPMVAEAEFRFYTASFIPVVRMPGISIEETLKEDNIVGRYIKDHNGENKYFAVEVTGDAMLPILKNGDLALIDVERQAFDSDLVCVVTANRYLIRYLAGRQEGKIILKPANSLYPDIAINEEEIKKIYRISETSSITIH